MKIAGAMENVENANTRLRLGFKLFDSEGAAIVRTLKLGEEGLEDYAAQAERFGIAVDRVDAAKIEQANDAMFLARQRLQGIGNIIAIEIAPVIRSLSNAFIEGGGDAEDMGETVRGVLDRIAQGVGLIGDAFFGWQLVFAQLEVKLGELSVKFDEFQESSTDNKFFDLMREATQVIAPELVEQGDKLKENAADFRAENRAALEAAKEHLATLVSTERPSVRIAAALEKARKESEAAARAAAENAETGGGTTTPGESDTDRRAREQAETAVERQRDQLQRQLEQVVEFQRTREESEIAAHERRQAIVQEALENEFLTHERALELQTRLQIEHEQRLTSITKSGFTERQKFAAKSAKEQAAQVVGELVAMTEGVAATNKTMFRLNKIAAIAEATINAHRAVQQALAHYPPPLSFAMAAAQAAAAAVQIRAIQSTSFGGGTTPSAAGSTPTLNGQPTTSSRFDQPAETDRQSAPQYVLQVNVEGSVIGPGGTRQLRDALFEMLREDLDRGKVLFDVSSRQATDILRAR